MKKLILIQVCLAAIVLSGCRDYPQLYDYKCSDDQLKLVEVEYQVCKQTGFLDSHCFLSAKVSLCDKVTP